MHRSPLATLLTVSLILLPGCLAGAAAAAGAAVGYVYYEKNEARRDFKASFDRTWTATLDALREEGFVVPDREPPKDGDGTIEAKDLWVRVERHPDGVTRVLVRVGTFDNEEHRRKSALILERIGEKVD